MSVTQPPATSSIPLPTPRSPWRKRVRRTATAVLAGDFDERPARDALTSLLNGVPAYKAQWEAVWEKQENRKEKKELQRQKSRKKDRTLPASSSSRSALSPAPKSSHSTSVAPPTKSAIVIPLSSIPLHHQGRPTIHIPSATRMASVTPPPASPILLSTPASTPGPASSNTSRTSSKRLRTPDDYDVVMVSPSMKEPPMKKKRVAVKKGWKGWVEGSPEPSDKLINLDDVPIMQERRTRSGKNFDAY